MPVRDSILAMIYDFKHCQNVTEVAIAHLMDLLLGAQVVRRSGILGGGGLPEGAFAVAACISL